MSQPIEIQPKFLWFLILSYAVVLIIANWYDARLVRIFYMDTDAGILIFPLTFILADIITEVYGYQYTRLAIWCGFLFNFIFLVYGQLVIHLPSPPYAKQNVLFDSLLAVNVRIVLSSFISYLCSEPLNALLLAKLKVKMQGKQMGLRFVTSTFIAAGLDSFIFGSLAFFNLIDHLDLLKIILTMWFIKVLIEVIGLPFSIRIAKRLKQIEKLDMYDAHTEFNLFKLKINYQAKDNHYE